MKSKLLIGSLFVLTAGVVAGYPLAKSRQHAPAATSKPLVAVQPIVAKPVVRPKIDVVFVLDTTGSMGGLIDAAKENIWSIASTMAQAQPTPELRIGLVAFRDRGDDYVTRVVDLSSDLDSMYATLMDFRAEGGGDTPESVNQALHDAVHRISWSQDRDAYQVIFLVGDAPPHMDYADDVKYPNTIKAAVARGIVVNTILAGADGSTEAEWKRIAQLNQGEYFKVAQTGSAVSVTTPFDEKIAALSKSLDDTRMFFGDAQTQAQLEAKDAAADKLHAGGSYASRAKRAAFNASEAGQKNLLGENELVDAVASGRLDLDKVDAAHLPADFRELDRDKQALVIKEKSERRAELNAEIAALSMQRRDYIATEVTSKDGTKGSLDQQIFDTVKVQAAEKGLRYEAAAPAL